MKSDRNKEILSLRSRGFKISEIATRFNLSRERIYQLIYPHSIRLRHGRLIFKSRKGLGQAQTIKATLDGAISVIEERRSMLAEDERSKDPELDDLYRFSDFLIRKLKWRF